MDKKLLQSLDNLSYSLGEIANSLEERNKMKSSVGSALQSGNFSKQLSEISVSISKVKSDTESILKNQETILRIVRDKKEVSSGPIKTVKNQSSIVPKKESLKEDKTKEESFFGKIKDNSKPIKDSVGTILMIAGGILAIGASFKIIGDVNWVSVLALSTSLPLIAHSFSKISEIKMSPLQVASMLMITAGISTAILSSSYLLSMVKPVGFFQAATAIMIGGVFSALSFGIGKIIKGFEGVSPGLAVATSFLMPIVLYAVSYSIAKSSELLSQVRPIGFFQATTSILIAGVFTALSYGIGKLIMGFKGVSPGLALGVSLAMPLVLVALSWSIAKSSELLSQVRPIGFFQAVTAIMISGVFTVLAYGIGKMISGFRGVSPASAAIAAVSMPLLLIALSGSIMYSSELLSNVKPIGFFQALTSILISGVFVVLSYSVKPLMKGLSGVSYGDILKGGVIILGLVGTIVASSYIINSIQDVPLSKIGTFTLLSISLIGSSIAFGFGLRVLSKIPVSEILKGGIAVLAIATVISVSSMILSIGKYDKYPSLDWTMGTGASLLAFGLSTIGLGLIAASGIGAIALLAGAAATLGVAGLIVGVDAILSVGSYSKFPSISWSLGVGGSLLAFSTAVVTLGAINSVGGIAETLSLGVVDNPIDAGILATAKISAIIPVVDSILSKGSYKSYPSLSWAGGVSTLMTIVSGAVILLGGIGSIGGGIYDRGVEALRTISNSIVEIDSILSVGKYVKGPTRDWADGISLALSAFSPIYSILMKNSIMKIFGAGVSVDKFGEAIRTITIGIVTASNHLSLNKSSFVNGPPVEWSEGVSKSLAAFSPIYDILLENSGILKSGITPEKYTQAIKTIVEGISLSAKHFADNKSSFENPPPTQWASGVGSAISAFSPVYEALSGQSSWFGNSVSVSEMNSAIKTITTSIISSSQLFGKNVFGFDTSKIPDKKWSENVNGSILAFSPIFKFVSDNSGWFGSDASQLSQSIRSISQSIADSSKILSYGIFNYTIPVDFIDNISKNVKSYVGMMELTSDVDNADILNIIGIVASLSRISQLIQLGSYKSSIPLDYSENISKNVESYLRMVNDIDVDVDGLRHPINVVESISKMSKMIPLGSFGLSIPKDFTEGAYSNVKSYVRMIDAIGSNIGNIQYPINVVGSISRMSQIIQLGSFNSIIPLNFTENVSKNIQSYLKTLDMIGNNEYENIAFPIRFVVFLNNISDLISKGAYDFSIPLNFTENVSKNIESYVKILTNIDGFDSVDISLPIRYVSNLVNISHLIQNGIYKSSIPLEFAENLLRNIESYIKIIDLSTNRIDNNLYSPSLVVNAINDVSRLIDGKLYTHSIPLGFIDNLLINAKSYKELVSTSNIEVEEVSGPMRIIRSINRISELISGGKYLSKIPDSYLVDVGRNIRDYLSILGIRDFIETQFIDPLSIIKSINRISEVISEGDYNSIIPDKYLSGIESNIKKYYSVIDFLSKNNPNSDIIFSTIKNISRISDLVSDGNFETSIPENYVQNIRESILGFISLSKISQESKFNSQSVADISKSISLISNIISSGVYLKYPGKDWTDGSIRSIGDFSNININNPNINNAIGASELILEIDSIFNLGSYDKYPSLSWVEGSTKSIIRFIESIGSINSISFVSLLSAFQKAKMVSKSIIEIDSIFSKGSYVKHPSLEWIDSSKESILRSGNISLEIENRLPLLSLISGIRKSKIISGSIFEISNNLSRGSYDIYPSFDWSNSISKILRGFSGLDLSGDMDKDSLSNTVNSILFIDSKFRSGNFSKFPSVEWSSGTSFAIQKIRDLISMMRFDSIQDGLGKVFGRKDPLQTALSNIDQLAISFEKLSESVKSFTGGISSIDLDKLSAIRSLSSSVVLMSISDSDQFNRMMDRLEDRSGVFADLINSYNESRKSSGGSISIVKSLSNEEPKDSKYEDLFERLGRMISLLEDIASVAGSKGTLKSHLMSIKDDINIGSQR